MEVSALTYPAGVGRYGRSPLLRIQSDEHLIKLIRSGNDGAFEVIVSRYDTRLLSFCRHLLGSREDAEDVLQEAFSAAYHAILADQRPINVRPWLYRIARNRCLNHLRRVPAVPSDTMDVLYAENGETTADKVHRREEFRLLVGDIHELAETQRTALLLREMDALSYEQIAEAMETTVSSVKSLLVRARVSLAEASEARLLSCEDVRGDLGEVAEGLIKRPSPLVRRHLRNCERCVAFNQQLRRTNRALGALLPVGPLALLKGGVLAHLTGGHGAATVTGSAATAGASSSAAGSGAAASLAGAGASSGVAGVAAGSSSGLVSAGIGALATKTAAGLAVAAALTAGVAVSHPPSATPHASRGGASTAASSHARSAAAGAGAAAASARSSAATRRSASRTAHRVGAGSGRATATHRQHATSAGAQSPVGHSVADATHSLSTGSGGAASAGSVTAAAATTAAAAASSTAATGAAGTAPRVTAAGSSGKPGRHGTAISSSASNPGGAGTHNILSLGGSSAPSSSTPTLPGSGGSASSAPSSAYPSGGSAAAAGPVAGTVSEILSSVTGGASATPGS